MEGQQAWQRLGHQFPEKVEERGETQEAQAYKEKPGSGQPQYHQGVFHTSGP